MSGVGVAKVAQILDLCNFIPQMELKGHRIMIRDVNRPALQLSGYFEHFEQSRVQIIGTVEYTYLQQLDEKKKEAIYREFMAYDIPCVIFCRDLKPDEMFLKIAEESNLRYSEPSEAHRVHGGADLLPERAAGTVHHHSRRACRCLRRGTSDYGRERHR